MPDELSLRELADASGLQPRTIRSWVAQKLVPAPLNRGPMARYPAETLDRLRAIRAMRDILRMPLAKIRQELLVATPDALRELADKAKGLAPEPVEPGPAPTSTALEYIRRLRQDKHGGYAASSARETSVPASSRDHLPAPPIEHSPPFFDAAGDLVPHAGKAPKNGFEALEHQLGIDRTSPARQAHAEEWLHLPITPEVELAVRGPLDPEARARLERCADLIRNILLGTRK